MNRTEISPGVTRVRLAAGEAAAFTRIVFADEKGTYLAQEAMEAAERPVYRLAAAEGRGEVRQTANGEVTVFGEETKKLVRTSHTVRLRFSCAPGQVLTGLGQHEDGIFDYSRGEERLYQHNMKIAVPFLLGSGGWGLLIEAGCAMRFRGHGDGFDFLLDAADTVSYAVIRGADCAEVLKKLSSLTGKPALLPKWAYGYIQSKERYNSAAELTETAGEFRRRGLGLDCIVQDWFTWREGCWGDKEPDPERYPDIRALTDALHAMNVRLMVSVWPNIDGGRDGEEMAEAGYFLPASRIYDAFSPQARDLYWRQCRRYWMDGGADALWCDSCEPITDPDWCGAEKRDEDERMRLLTEASALRMDPEEMNRYGSAHLRGLYEHWRRDFPEKRPVLLARSGGPESCACGAVLWSGDVSARWDVLEHQVTEGIKAACSGIGWWTLDIGAFFTGRREPWFWRGDYPDGAGDPAYRELYIRWLQFGAMLPVFRSHGTETPREPWRFGGEDSPEYARVRDVIALRYRLLPYLYACAAWSARDGLPMMRAMMAAFPEAPELYPAHDMYMLGDALLVKPVTRPLSAGGGAAEVPLPPGGWYDWFTRRYYEGGRTVTLRTPPERFPLLARAGSVIPAAEGARCAADAPVPAREILVFCGADGAFDLYDDAGDGYGEGITIPLRYREADGTLVLGRAAGRLPGETRVTVRFLRPDGSREKRDAVYTGEEIRIAGGKN